MIKYDSPPTTAGDLADKLQLRDLGEALELYDVCVVGAGPAGLASAVQAAAAGLTALVLERAKPGGKPIHDWSTASPTAVLPAISAAITTPAFAPHAIIGAAAMGLCVADSGYDVVFQNGQRIHARSVVIATGAQYRPFEVPNDGRYNPEYVHYTATGREAALCVDEEVLIQGGGMMACRAAVFLGGVARRVEVFVRDEGLASDVSEYLRDRIRQSPCITIQSHVTIRDLHREDTLHRVFFVNEVTGKTESRKIRHIFILSGMIANTAWLAGCLSLDENGFIVTVANAANPADRFETSSAGVFAVGDVRANSTKEVAAAFEEGVAVVAEIQRYLENA